MKIEWRNIAKLNIVKNRLAAYLGGANFLMLTKIFTDTFTNKTLALILMISGVAVLLILGYIDYKYIMPHELNIQYEKGGMQVKNVQEMDSNSKR